MMNIYMFLLFSQDLEKVREDVQDLTVKEAVAKNAFEKSAKAGKDQVYTQNYKINKHLLFECSHAFH